MLPMEKSAVAASRPCNTATTAAASTASRMERLRRMTSYVGMDARGVHPRGPASQAACDRVQPRLELRRDVAARVAVEAAGTRAADQRDLHHLAACGDAVEIAAGQRLVARVVT